MAIRSYVLRVKMKDKMNFAFYNVLTAIFFCDSIGLS
jgi:hypothetical protein